VLAVAEDLATFPERGTHPWELLAVGVREYQQVFFKPYRVIYRVIGKQEQDRARQRSEGQRLVLH
jgi:toxin ParE1/3/4